MRWRSFFACSSVVLASSRNMPNLRDTICVFRGRQDAASEGSPSEPPVAAPPDVRTCMRACVHVHARALHVCVHVCMCACMCVCMDTCVSFPQHTI